MEIPKFIVKLLWDVKLADLSLPKDAGFIIERVLEYGDMVEFSWLEENFEKEEILDKLKNSENLSTKSANFYAFFYQLPKSEIKVLQKEDICKQLRFS